MSCSIFYNLLTIHNLFSYAANEIQRVFRGIVGRLKSLSEAVQKSQRRKLYYLHYLCIQLQRCFRGYHSRKYKYDQARRKLYIRMLEEKRREVLQQMEKYAAEQAEVSNHLIFSYY